MGEEYRPLDLSAAEAALPALAFYSDPDVGGYVISHGNSWYRGQAINELNVSTLLWLANVQATGGPLADARDAAEAYMNGILQNPGYVRIPYGQYRFATIGSVMSDDPEYIRWISCLFVLNSQPPNIFDLVSVS
ncbi:uncharacterized protein SCHCODRAFT_02669107 [Schizophyllum commune H4-8]|nr:uncharacterized protein SCHCODRAFT_02669107 [Schizophyllum commune H4-8]KAI5891840.1 hypothetical protein SCHCODRAFT_02669107 [Schizophyllum commune H4-8]